jgi:hypothetical protein
MSSTVGFLNLIAAKFFGARYGKVSSSPKGVGLFFYLLSSIFRGILGQ